MQNTYRCLIVDEMHNSIKSMLKELSIDADYYPELSREEIIDRLSGYDILLIRSKTKVDKELLVNADSLKVVGRAGAGTDNIHQKYLESRNIAVINAAEGNRDAVGEHTMAMLLSLMHNVVKSHMEVSSKIWNREGNRGVELSGKTVGVIGYGNMGKAFAKRLCGFGCKVIAYDKYLHDFSDDYCQQVELQGIFDRADVVSLHVPLTDETKGWVDENFFNKFNESIYFLNMARGEIVLLSSIRKALESGKVVGAALDVLENEKMSKMTPNQEEDFAYLTHHKNVILTPHIGGWSFESYEKINQVLVKKLKTLISC